MALRCLKDLVRSASSERVSDASLSAFRVVLGVTLLLSSARLFAYGWIEPLYLAPQHQFSFWGFAWVPRLDAPWLQCLVAGVGCAGAALAMGWHTRLSATTAFVTFTWLELMDKTLYLNHYYAVSLMLLWLALTPSATRWSWDARSVHRQQALSVSQGGRPEGAPEQGGLVTPECNLPVFVLWFFRAQVAVIYVYAGVAKLNADWLLHAEPLQTWLLARHDFPVFGALFALAPTAFVFSWAGAIFDLMVIPALLYKPTRGFALIAVVVFHTLTGLLFPIGVFPLVMVAGATLFLKPTWPTELGERLRLVLRNGRSSAPPPPRRLGPLGVTPPMGAFTRSLLVSAMAVHLAIQVALPLRHLAMPGPVLWNEAGFRFSWRVMLAEKGGSLMYRVESADGRQRVVAPSEFLTPLQARMTSTQPDMILEAAHWLSERHEIAGTPPRIYADAWVSLNGRPPAQLIDPTVDLAAQRQALGTPSWILPSPDSDSR